MTSTPIIIRDAERSDYPALAALQVRSWRDVYRSILPDAYLDDRIEDDFRLRWAALRPSGKDKVLVAERGVILGFVTVWCQPDPFIDNLHVEPGQRSQGIGLLLMREAAARLITDGFTHMSLYVAAQNHRARAFYERLGGSFGEVEPIHQEHGGSVDAIAVVWDDLTKVAAAS